MTAQRWAPVLTLDELYSAQRTLEGVAHRTPVMRSTTLDSLAGGRVFLKCESFQRSGSFKFRGAYTFLHRMPRSEVEKGVCTVSSGNHAQAVALAAKQLGLRAAVLMPDDAPAVKREATLHYGAEIVEYERLSRPQALAGEDFAAERGLPFVPAYDHPTIAAGAGTAVLELLEEVNQLDQLIAPIGGGGGISGYAAAVKRLFPACRVIGVEAAASAVTKRSLEAGRRIEVPLQPHIADGQMLTTPGEWTFEAMRSLLDDVVLVDDTEILTAMAFLFDRMKLVTEPSGAIAVAALLAGRASAAGGRTGVIISGGNVGLDRFVALMGAELNGRR
ncbi:pyridoxal-phosphate dependent enzyme [Nonomuraea zeae]|uniref:threonine ammonia-lyase n=1 Tax=Nonomuraea zeae TaxID=1642303 RepID=A0A5S4G4A0_9ACTN|nr:pyridoxal-phosphate dependent enzyme [Nonomuraea zeae]TMR27769.1 pyridoxal-phosphate dependent enzyme [Nonomuraea zeae]